MGRSGIEVPEEQTGCDLTAGLRGTNGETDVSTNPTSSSSWPSPSSIRTSSDTDTVCEKDFLVLLSQLVVMALLAASCFPARIVGPDAVCGRCLATNWVNPRPTAWPAAWSDTMPLTGAAVLGRVGLEAGCPVGKSGSYEGNSSCSSSMLGPVLRTDVGRKLSQLESIRVLCPLFQTPLGCWTFCCRRVLFGERSCLPWRRWDSKQSRCILASRCMRKCSMRRLRLGTWAPCWVCWWVERVPSAAHRVLVQARGWPTLCSEQLKRWAGCVQRLAFQRAGQSAFGMAIYRSPSGSSGARVFQISSTISTDIFPVPFLLACLAGCFGSDWGGVQVVPKGHVWAGSVQVFRCGGALSHSPGSHGA